jgi:hypothetical protein
MVDGSAAIVAHYADGVEADRLSYGPGQVELRRTMRCCTAPAGGPSRRR